MGKEILEEHMENQGEIEKIITELRELQDGMKGSGLEQSLESNPKIDQSDEPWLSETLARLVKDDLSQKMVQPTQPISAQEEKPPTMQPHQTSIQSGMNMSFSYPSGKKIFIQFKDDSIQIQISGGIELKVPL